MGRSAHIATLAALAAAGCIQRDPHVVLTVEDPQGLAAGFSVLAVGADRAALDTVEPERRELPLSLTVARTATGDGTLWVEARAADGLVLGRGATLVRFARGGAPAATVTLSRPCDADLDCDDGAFCSGAETCAEGRCVAGTPPCGSSFPCVRASCVERGGGEGSCSVAVDHAVCEEGTYCNAAAGCVPGRACELDADCDDGAFCNGLERCVGRVCRAGTPPAVGDGDPCTVDGCSESEGAFHVGDPALDGNTCVLTGVGREVCIAAAGGCAPSSCGDGFVDRGATPAERCDDGPLNHDEWSAAPWCNTTCSAIAPHCGDGVVDPAETCDDGNAVDDGNDCSAACTCAGPACISGTWAGLGASDFASVDTRVHWGSTSYYGAWTPYSGRFNELDVAAASDGTVYVASLEEIEWAASEVFVHAWDGEQWTDLSGSPHLGISATSNGVYDVALALDAAERPVVAWADWHSIYESEIYASRFDGTRWVDIGTSSSGGRGVSDSPDDVADPRLVRDSAGNLVVFWVNSLTGRSEIYGKRFNGVSWQPIGVGSASGTGISASAGYSTTPAVIAGPSGTLFLAWSDSASGRYQIFVKTWTGSAWAELGTGSASGMGISASTGHARGPSLALDGTGKPIVAWYDDGTPARADIYVKRWDGLAWVEWNIGSATGGGVSGGDPRAAHSPKIALLPDGNPYVVWNSGYPGSTGDVLARRWDGAQWSEVGPGSSTAPGLNAQVPSVSEHHLTTMASGAPLLVFGGRWDATVYALTWNGSQWLELPGTGSGGALSASTGTAVTPTLVMDAAGRPTVFWSDDASGNFEIYGRGWDGSAWQELGAGSASAGGISASSGASQTPTAAIDDSGAIVLAWTDHTPTPGPHVYLARWNGLAWEELSGSRTAGGLSAAEGSGVSPRVAVDAQGRAYVAYFASASVFVRRFDGDGWTTLGGGPVGSAAPNNPLSLVVSASGPVIAWASAQGRTCAARFDGAAWTELSPGSAVGECIDPTGWATSPQLALDGQGRVVLALADYIVGSQEIHVSRWDGSVWSSLEETAFPFGNASRSVEPSYDPSLALDEYGRPVVAWVDHTTPGLEADIHVRRWTSSRWVELGEGSATAGGISNSVAPSLRPSIGVRGRRACVAWSEPAESTALVEPREQIVVRCVGW